MTDLNEIWVWDPTIRHNKYLKMVPVRAIIRACKRFIALITRKPQPKDGVLGGVIGETVERGATAVGCGPSQTVSAKAVPTAAPAAAAEAPPVAAAAVT